MDHFCKCSRCKNVHRESERVNGTSRDGITDVVCPRCGCREYYDMSELVVTIKQQTGTYIARCHGKVASATAGPEQAAMACAKKVMPGYEISIAEAPKNHRFYKSFIATVKEA